MYEKFTEKSIKVIMLAQEESRRLGHNFVGTEQILLGLIGEETGVAAKVLKSLGVNLKDSRVEVEKIIGIGSGSVSLEAPFTPRAKNVQELSLEKARQLGHDYIGTEHLLLGIVIDGECVAARVLEKLGVILSDLQSLILDIIDRNKKTNETNKNDISDDKFDENLSIKEYLAILGVYNENQIEENDIYFWWTKKFKEIEGESISRDVKSSLLIKINNAKDELESIAEEKIINSLKLKRNQTNYSDKNEVPVNYEYSTNHSKPDKKTQQSNPESSKSKIIYEFRIDNLTPEVVTAIELAKNELIVGGYNCLGTEQILTGLFLIDCSSSEILSSLGVNLSKLRKEILNFLGKGDGFIVENIPFTPNAKYVFESAQKEAFKLKIAKVDSLIILLCLIKSEKFLSYKILNSLNIDIYDLQEKIYKHLGKETYLFFNSNDRFKSKIKNEISKCEGYISNKQYAKAIIELGKLRKTIIQYKISHKILTKTFSKFLDKKILFLTEKLAISKSKSNDFWEAVKDYDLLIEQNYSLVNCLYNRAKIFLKLKSYSRALNDLERLLTLYPSMLSVLLLRAEIFEDIQNYNSALNDYTKIKSISLNYRSSYVSSKINYLSTIVAEEKRAAEEKKAAEENSEFENNEDSTSNKENYEEQISYEEPDNTKQFEKFFESQKAISNSSEEVRNKRNFKHQKYISDQVLLFFIVLIFGAYLILLINALLA